MKRFLKWAGIVIAAALVLLFAGLLGGYALLRPVAEVPRTVAGDPSLPFLQARGAKLHAEAFGEGPGKATLVVLHGGPGDDYRSLLPLKALADTFQVVFYDQRGSGLSERVSAEQLSLDAFYQDLDAVAAHWAPGKPVHLVGHSWGGMLAAGWAGRNPGRVAGLVLAEPGLLTDEAGAAFLEKTNRMQPPMTVRNLGIVGRAFLESRHIDGPDEQARADYLALRVMGNPDVEGHPLAGYWCDRDLRRAALEHWRFGMLASEAVRAQGMDPQGRFRVDFGKGLDQRASPVLFLVGACDQILGEEHQRQFHVPLFRAPRVVVIPGAGHTMLGERPAESVAAIRAYLAEFPQP